MDPGSDDVEKGLGKLHLTMPRLDEKDVHNLATVSEASDGEWSSNVQMGEAGPAMTADAHNNPRSGSPVYGFGASDEYPDEPGFASRPPSLVFGTSGIRASLETQTSMFAVNGRKSPGHTSATPHQLAPDFSWIVEHHNHELITTIRLQEPTHLAKLVQAVRKWRPWAARGGAATDQNIDANKTEWQREDSRNSFRISVAELHRIRMRKLQCKLASHAWYMKRFKKEPPDWEHDLQEYTKALQDYDYMIKCSATQRDCFLISGERKVDDYVMQKVGVQTDPRDADAKNSPIPVLGPWEEDNIPIGGTRNENVKKSWVRGFRRRLVMAAVGGTFLVAPMWLMVLHNTLYTALVSTTVFVLVFGSLMSALLEKPMDVLSGTAAYAAVLVVFVGLGPSGGPSETSQ